MFQRLVCLMAFVLLLGLARLTQAGLVGWWQLDEGTGATAKDSSGNGNDGTLQGNPTVIDGPFGKALAFANQRVAIPASKTLGADLFKGPFTVAGWINPKRTGNAWQQVFRAIRTAGNSNDTLFLNTDGRLSWRGLVSGAWAGGMCETAAGVVPADQWTHFAVTGDKTNFRIYVNAALSQTSNWQTTDGANANYYIGGDPATAGESYSGMADEVRVYDLVLTVEQIKEICVGDAPSLAKAQDPSPANGALAVVMPLLQWKPGMDALFHSVYVGTSPELTEANLVAQRQMFTMLYYVQGFQPGTTYYWRVDEIGKDGTTVQTGNVWTFVAQDLKAYYPTPADGTNEAAPAPDLTWLPGQTAIKHHVYFGDNSDAVKQGAAGTDKGEVKDPNFAPGTLESLATYYWRVDELVVGGTVRTGSVWKFTTCLSVDDFEGYTDQAGSEIFAAWTDGFTNGLSGSTVGYLTASNGTYGETVIVHSGKQSMPIDYNNVKSPFYSEVTQEFAAVQDWTAGGADTLVLYVQGRSGNAPAPLYITVEDSAKKVGVVVHADTAVVKATQWTPWKIPLGSLTGVNLARVKKLTIGVGDKSKPAAGGAGRIFVDDIRVTKP